MSNNSDVILGGFLGIVLLCCFILLGPLLFFWAVKTLCGFVIPLTFKNIIAFYVISILFRGKVYNKSVKKD